MSTGNNRVEYRATDAQMAKIKARALAAGTTVSEFSRSRALGVKPKPGIQRARKASIEGAGSEPGTPASAREPAKPSPEVVFVEMRTAELVQEGRIAVVARSEAEAEWRNRVRRGLV